MTPGNTTLEQAVQDFLKARAADPQLTPEKFCDASPHLLGGLLQVLQAITASNDGTNTFLQQPSGVGPAVAPSKLGVYAVQRKLGEGGMGAVYLAMDTRLDRPVAIKVMRPEIASQATARARFLREAKAMASVKHEHVATIHAANEEADGTTWLAMELLEGEALDDAIKRGARFDWKAVMRLGREIALGLGAAHAKKLIHRDIKPANIWLEAPEAKVKLLDFGLARQVETEGELTGSGAMLGTPSYMSPEQANGDPVDGRCDLFSLGVLLYRLTTGKLPFAGATVMATITALATKDPTPVKTLRPDCPTGLADLIHRLLAKNRDHRPATAKAVADELLRLDRDGSQTEVMLPPIVEAMPVADPWAAIDDGPSELIQTASAALPVPVVDASASSTPARRKPWLVVLPLLLLLLAGGGYVIIKVTNKDGTTTELKVPDSAKVEVIDNKGKTVALVPPTKSADPLPAPVKNALGMEFVKVPKGTGWLGGGAGNQGETKVVIEQDFYLGKYEVTQEEWEAVTGLNPSHFSRNGAGKDAVKDITDADLKRFPVEMVSWDDCQLFIKRLNEKEKDTGWVYRLPKETEWEYACRGGPVDKLDSAFDFYFAKPTNTLLPDQAKFEFPKALKQTSKVGSYEPNRLGLHDMHGNVWEWCEDTEKVADGASLRVARGGGWHSDSGHVPAASRSAHPPSGQSNNIGLRLARVPVGKEAK